MPSLLHLFVAVVLVLFFLFLIKYLPRVKYGIYYVALGGLVLVLGTNLLQGWNDGFVRPIAGGEIQYYHDAIDVEDIPAFIRGYEQLQPELGTHSKTHPPGAVILITLLRSALANPAYISIVIAVASSLFSAFFLHKILSNYLYDAERSSFVVFIFLLVPSIQIYYLASLDALIASILLGSLYFFLHRKVFVGIVGSGLLMLGASFLTFAFLHIIVVMVGFGLLRRRHLLRSASIVLSLSIIYALLFIVFDFNYLNSLRIATALENPDGFRLFAEPISYIFTRIEGLYEVIIFLGPFLLIMTVGGMSRKWRTMPDLLVLTWLAVLSYLVMLATGAFRTGETARAAIYIYPYLMFPIAYYLRNIELGKDRFSSLLPGGVFAQTMFMQLFGRYFW